MESFLNVSIFAVFVLELVLLTYFEIKAWKTIFTPLNFLMLPYAFILLVSIAISGNMGFVEFYYPSILIWCYGLLVFAVPSLVLSYLMQKQKISLAGSLSEDKMPKSLVYLSLFVILLFALRFYTIMGSASVASKEFGVNLAGSGFWGHLRQLALPLLIMAIYFVSKKRWWLWLIIIPIVGIACL